MLNSRHLPPTITRVARHTSIDVNAQIRARTDAAVAQMERASPAELTQRIALLDREWDIERVLQANAATLALTGVLLGRRVHPRFLLLSAGVFGFLLQHALQGWCPPLPVLRRLGVRTAAEIERERYALKAMRGDFDELPTPDQADGGTRVRAVLQAVDR